jgi:hypothetical protein
MKYRVAAWASAGFIVAGFWAVYFLPFTPMHIDARILRLARFTCPIALLGSYFHFGVRFYWVLVANTAAYALAGLAVEPLWRLRTHLAK